MLALPREDVRDRLAMLREAGAEAFDGPGFRFIEGLVSRSESLGSAAAERLLGRASVRLEAFEVERKDARALAERSLEALDRADADADGSLRAAFERGDYRSVNRRADRLLRLARDDGSQAARRRLDRLDREARARGLVLPATLRDRLAKPNQDGRAARRVGDELAQLIFRDAAEHARSALVVARASDAVPEEVGPYNAQALSVQALGLLESVSPTYLRALLGGLEELSALRTLPERPKPRRRRRGR